MANATKVEEQEGARAGAGGADQAERQEQREQRREREEQGGGSPARLATPQGRQGMARSRRGAPQRLTPSDLFTLSPFELLRRLTGEGMGDETWFPPVEIAERDGRLVVRMDVPGIEANEVNAQVTGDGLLIEGERRCEHEERDRGILRCERVYGRFQRLIPLPAGARAEDAIARVENGVLQIEIPIDENAGRRRIPIDVPATQ